MKSQRDLAKAFDRGAEEGEASNMFISGDTIYSYGTHFPVAYRINGGYIFNTDKYSTTTSCHQTIIKRELSGEIIETDKETLQEIKKHGANSLEELKELKMIEGL